MAKRADNTRTITLDGVQAASVQRMPGVDEYSHPVVFMFAQKADECPEWWTPHRDYYLRKFWPTEPFLASTIYSIAARNAAFRYEFQGPEKDVEYCQELFAQAEMGAGWHAMILKVTVDLLTQDNGAFIEVIRPAKVRVKSFTGDLSRYNGVPLEAAKVGIVDMGNGWGAKLAEMGAPVPDEIKEAEVPVWAAILPNGQAVNLLGHEYKVADSPLDLPIGLAHLDAGRCRRTGNPEFPVCYTDIDGQEHRLAWYQVLTLEDLPSPIEDMRGVGYCFVTRVFRAAQTMRDMEILKQEKASGRFAGSVYLTNVSAEAVQDAVDMSAEAADQRGLTRYMPPIIADIQDPSHVPAVARIDLASLPEGYNEAQSLEWYVAVQAMGSGVDYGFLAPLPGKGLGTASQSEQMAKQAKGKSSRLFMSTMEQKINYGGILPRSVTMAFKEADAEEEIARDQGRSTRANTRKVMIESGEITPAMARQMAIDDGDYDRSLLKYFDEEDVTPAIHRGDTERVTAELERLGQMKPIPKKEPPAQALPQAQEEKGGPESGHHEHVGRPGEQGGSSPGWLSSTKGLPVYHGTAPWIAAKIKEEGIRRGSEWSGRPPSVYFADSIEGAHFYGELFGGSTYAVIEFGVPTGAQVIDDPEHPNAWRVEQDIPPGAIRDVRIFSRGQEYTLETMPEYLRKAKRLGYAVVGFVLEKEGKKGGPGSGNWAHTGDSDQHGGSDEGGGISALGVPADSTVQDRRRRARIITGHRRRDRWNKSKRNLAKRMVNEETRPQAEAYADSQISMVAGYTSGVSEAQLSDTLTKATEEAIRDAPLTVAASPSVAMKIFEAEQFKNQHEVGISGGMLNPARRKQVERNAFTISEGDAPEDYPIYGYLDSPKADNMVGQYGYVRFVLKDSAKGRATYTVGDSLLSFEEKRAVGLPVNGPVSKANWDRQVDDMLMQAQTGSPRIYYYEAQIHGGVSIFDVERIWFASPRNGSYKTEYDAVERMAQKYGIPVGTREGG